MPNDEGRVRNGLAFLLVNWRLHTLIHTLPLETELQYFVLNSLGAEV
jgi:hypothetical protein